MKLNLMGRIYQDSSQVCIWLGDAADESDQAMQLINDHAQMWLMMSSRLCPTSWE
jgi:hypothetical protein